MTDVKPLDDLLQELDTLPDVDDVGEPAPPPRVASQIEYRDYPVLVVDDEEENILAFQLNFRHDFTVDAATSGAEALERLKERTYAVVVTDQRMPGMSGVELLEQTVDAYPHLIRIIVTGYTDNQSLIDAINMGRIYKYVTKPWSRDEMAVTIKRAIETYSLSSRPRTRSWNRPSPSAPASCGRPTRACTSSRSPTASPACSTTATSTRSGARRSSAASGTASPSRC